ncbi:transient receptor potential cation channel subfamily M member 5 [Sinocyclocheilus rhinocerous]|nr:PREDICTED: transient receptor potential cation channel subfamily M member 5-like [Sinocyclocheilus rhinocerous]
MLGHQDTPLGVSRQGRRCLQCGELLNESQEHGSLPGCRCYIPLTESVVHMGEKGNKRFDKPQWMDGRLGDIDFVGVSRTRGKFVRVTSSTDPAEIYQMLTKQWGLAPPHLVVALMGGDEVSQLKPWLRDTLRKGLVKAAQSTGAWILTSGLRFGITKNLGQAVRDHSLASTSTKVRVVAIGIAPWNMIQNRDLLLSAKPDHPAAYPSEDLPHGAVYSLDCNHSHFILVDEDPQRPGSTGEMRVKMLKHISLQRTGYGGTGSIEIPVLCLLVHGEPRILQRMYKNIQNSIPWLILAGSGGVADILVTLMDRGCWDADMVQELLINTFTNSLHSTEITSWIKLIQRILDHGHLLTVHDPEQDSELDTVVLKALVKACKSQSQEAQDFLDELKLAVAWNRVDIAKSEIFSGDVAWSAQDLEEVMMEALINDKPDFVRLFVDNGVNINEFLTYGRLQELYCSVSEKNLLHTLLLKKHQEKQAHLASKRMSGHPHTEPGDRRARFTFHEVSKVLKDFLDDTCRGFYQKLPAERMGKGRLFHSQKNLPDMDRRCDHPWRDLFLWAILQNRQEMANYFWAMGPEAVAAALVGCKIMKEMAHLATEAATARSMKNAKYEQFAMDLFSECYSNSEDRAYSLLVRKTCCWSKATVLNLATLADAKCFFAHDGVQALLTKVWWGAMRTDTSIARLVLTFFIPPLIWTNLIKFDAEVTVNKGDGEPFTELDSLETEQALLLTDEDPVAAEGGSDSCNASFIYMMLQKWNRFWSAPVTVFLGNVIMYFAFLILFCYVLLLDFRPPPPHGPSAAEIILYFWVFTLVLEEIRQSFFTDEDMSIFKKIKLYVEDNWNKCDMVAISLFVVGLSCRMASSTYEAGRTVLALDFMVFTLRLIHIFAIHKQLGPKIIIVERMIKDVFFFLFFLSVWLIAYGVTTQALLHPNDPRIDWVFRRALYRPYLHIFGQIPLEEIDAAKMSDDNCTTDVQEIVLGTLPPCPNVYANWLVILLLVIYLLVTNVLLLNLLIAMFSYTFQVVQENADIFWKFQRYNLIVEYHSRPALAPPFIIISHISQALLSLVKTTETNQDLLERELPAGLDQKLMTWETVQKENYLAKQEHEHRESSAERLRYTSSKVQSLLRMVGGFKEQEKRMATVETEVRYCGEVLSWIAECFHKSTLKCDRDAPKAPGSIAISSRNPQPQEAEQQQPSGHSGYGVDKKLPYIDQ